MKNIKMCRLRLLGLLIIGFLVDWNYDRDVIGYS